MEEQKVSLTTAKMLKEIGFDEICDFGYSKVTNNLIEMRNRNSKNIFISAPTQSFAQKWLREKYDIQIIQIYEHLEVKTNPYTYLITDYEFQIHRTEYDQGDIKYTGIHDTYEQALEKAIQIGLKIIKK